MEKHPIENIMNTTLGHLKEMTDVNTVVGSPVFTDEGTVVIPISKVGFGFVAGGGEYSVSGNKHTSEEELPFAGGAGAGVSVSPDGFLVISGKDIKYLPVQKNETLDKIFAAVPQILEQIKGMFELPCKCDGEYGEEAYNVQETEE
ncbi:MAG: GerW family sporulation protein [Clostridiales bacterium]|nr:GerW family sporulation protein [Clostridiales bacterium]